MDRFRTRHPRPRPRQPHLERGKPRPLAFVVGAGRLGRILARALSRSGWRVEASTRRSTGAIPGVKMHRGAFPESLREARLVLLTVPDRSIESTARALAEESLLRKGQIVAHCSGATPLSVLQPARDAGAKVGSLHPLFAASSGAGALAGCAAAVDGDPAALRLLRQVARQLELRPFVVRDEARPMYHAAASLAANGLVALADLAADLLMDAGADRRLALEALLPLLRSSLANLQQRGLPDALTGPVSRGDAAVVASHLRELRGQPALAAYRALQLRAVEISRAQGIAESDALDQIERLLSRRR